jgi:hypothetical protein
MKTPQLPGRARSPGKLRHREVARPLPLKVFIGYGDVPAVRRATGSIGTTLRESRRNVELQPMLWRFQQLASSHWRDRAIAAALEADIVVLTCSDPESLTADVEDWVNGFLAASRGRRATIVAITGQAEAWTISVEVPAAVSAQVAQAHRRQAKQRLVA